MLLLNHIRDIEQNEMFTIWKNWQHFYISMYTDKNNDISLQNCEIFNEFAYKLLINFFFDCDNINNESEFKFDFDLNVLQKNI